MTNKEAIYTLKNAAFLGTEEMLQKDNDAVEMAIEALEKQMQVKDECCANCKLCKTLWWWVYKPDGMIDHKEYGYVCTALENEGNYMKIDNLDGMCECFEEKEKK